MPDYSLYYWPIAFRGQFLRAVLAQVHATWDEVSFEEMIDLKSLEPREQPIPFMGPPVLIDHEKDFAVSQMPAALSYLSDKHGLSGKSLQERAIEAKLIGDVSDILYEMTRHHGEQTWTAEAWRDFQPRLARWMEILEEMLRRYRPQDRTGYLFGRSEPGVGDLVLATFWTSLIDRFAALKPMLEPKAPQLSALAAQVIALPEQAELRRRSWEDFGEVWCGGEIEASLRAVLS